MSDYQSFTLGGNDGSITLSIGEVHGFPNQTSWAGGYDCQGTVAIACRGYQARGELWFSTGQVYQFYSQLRASFNTLAGEARFSSTEGNLEFTVTFHPKTGHVTIRGEYQELHESDTCLVFHVESDQSFVPGVLNELSEIAGRYGDNHGVRR